MAGSVPARKRAIVPVYTNLLSDQLTPVSAFARLRGERQSFLLESVVGGEQIARYSFVAAAPEKSVWARGEEVFIQDGKVIKRMNSCDPLSILEEMLKDYQGVRLPAGPGGTPLPRFSGGWVGYAGYDTVRYVEHLPMAPPDDRNLPDLHFGLYRDMIIFDQVDKTIKLVHNAMVDGAPQTAYRAACAAIRKRLGQLQSSRGRLPLGGIAPDGAVKIQHKSNFKREGFKAAVRKCKQYIRAGDIFQVVISQRLQVNSSADPLDIYRALRVVNPSPFMFYLKTPECTLIGSSPEILCRVEDGVVTNRPLAGTRPRGHTSHQDCALEAELLADPKERAEHIMLVDLGRNDVGKVSQYQSVQLSDVMTVERYSHVMHITSNVRGQLKKGCSAMDALRATLPVGTVSGAPKVRAMQIIDELEPTRRGPYAGAVGYLDFNGNMDTCIALRTMVVMPAGRGRNTIYVQAGGGVVADSVPRREYEESMQKAKALLKAIELAQRGFDI